MAVHKMSVSLARELDLALDHACAARGESKSAVIQRFLYEHPEVKKYVELVRSEPDATILAAPRRSPSSRRVRPRA